jgi:hypothetical protein
MVYKKATAADLELREQAKKLLTYIINNFGPNYKSAVGVAGLDIEINEGSNPLQTLELSFTNTKTLTNQLGGIHAVEDFAITLFDHIHSQHPEVCPDVDMEEYDRTRKQYDPIPEVSMEYFFENIGSMRPEIEVELYENVLRILEDGGLRLSYDSKDYRLYWWEN